jgi:hypothetical protein
MSWIQNHPHVLEQAYSRAQAALEPFRRWLRRGGAVERLFIAGEKLTKGPIFDCRMCGQCILHSTGMTCPMTCPKTMRNGPCGGVRPGRDCSQARDGLRVFRPGAGNGAGLGDEILRLQPWSIAAEQPA